VISLKNRVSAPVHEDINPILEDLRINYFGEDISRLIREYRNQDSFKSYFDVDKVKYQFRGLSSFKDMISDDYFLLDHDSIIFISFVSKGSNKELVFYPVG
jgi:hypothetical protein